MIPKILVSESLNEMNIKAYDLIINSGKKTGNRNSGSLGEIFVEYDVNNVLTNPRKRHLNLPGRKSNIFALIGETFWVMAGRQDIDYLMNFIPRAKDYSDDGETWRASYGERMYYFDQLLDIENIFKNDGKFTRRASLTIYDPAKDSIKGLKETYGLDNTLDIPCNQWLQFYNDCDDNFNLKVVQRSGDAIWGAMSINITEFSFLHEVMYEVIKSIYPEIKLGSYNHSVTNFHLYEKTSSQAFEVLERKDEAKFEKDVMAMKLPNNMREVKALFKKITDFVENGEYFEIENFEDNLLDYYFYFVSLYVKLKKQGFRGSTKKTIKIPKRMKEFYLSDNGFAVAMRENSFRNFSII